MIADPYAVLGISGDASEEEIKKAYRTLSRRYHPDENVGRPDQEQLEEKFKQVQSAYQQIMKERTEGYGGFGGGSYGSSYGSSYGRSYGSSYQRSSSSYAQGGYGGFGSYQNASGTGYEDIPELRAAGNFIRSGYYREARTTLDRMEQGARGARWYYYSACANYGLGSSIQALEHARRAAAMEPDNPEYQLLVRKLESGSVWDTQRQAGYGFPSATGGDTCVRICLLNLACNVCCGFRGFCI